MEREEFVWTGKKPPKPYDEGWTKWREWVDRRAKPTPEDVAQAKIIRARVKQEQAERDATRRQREWKEEAEALASLAKT